MKSISKVDCIKALIVEELRKSRCYTGKHIRLSDRVELETRVTFYTERWNELQVELVKAQEEAEKTPVPYQILTKVPRGIQIIGPWRMETIEPSESKVRKPSGSRVSSDNYRHWLANPERD